VIRILAFDDVPADRLPAFEKPLPDILAQPLVLVDDDLASDWLRAHGTRLPLASLAAHAGRVVAVAPGALMRVLGHQTAVSECLFVAPDRSSALVEWRSAHDSELDFEWTCHDNADVALLFDSALEATALQSGREFRINAHVSLAANEPMRLIVTADAEHITDIEPTLWLRWHAAQTQRRRQEMLRIETGSAQIDRLWEWWTYLQSLDDQQAEPHIAAYLRSNLIIEADAERGRLVLQPRVTEKTGNYTAHNIAVGEARVRLDFERAENGCRFLVRQTAGSYPIRLILQPALPSTPQHCFVDMKPALLDARAVAEGVVVPVQIMLDEQRVVGFVWQ